MTEQTPHPHDWTCQSCSSNVFARHMSCFTCHHPKPGFKQGDWACLNKQCSAHNYASRLACFRCHVPRGAEKPGDWPCDNCRGNNFASRTECFRCRAPRPARAEVLGTQLSNVRPGDWLCPNPQCRSNVFASRDSCFRCQTVKPGEAQVASGFSDMRAGDWVCPQCQSLCFSHRQTCFKCEAVKPEGAAVVPQPAYQNLAPAAPPPPQPYSLFAQGGYAAAPHFAPYYGYPPGVPGNVPAMRAAAMAAAARNQRREGDWSCGACNSTNFARRLVCFKCLKPRNASGNDVKQVDGAGAAVAAPPAPQATSVLPTTWACSTCGNDSSVNSSSCTACGAAPTGAS